MNNLDKWEIVVTRAASKNTKAGIMKFIVESDDGCMVYDYADYLKHQVAESGIYQHDLYSVESEQLTFVSEHVMATCNCKKEKCPICKLGADICEICGKAEGELIGRCK